MPKLEHAGYRVLGILVRQQSHRKKTAGKKRRVKYEGEYVYVRIKTPDGRKRDLYLGSSNDQHGRWEKRGGEFSPAGAARRRRGVGWRKQVEKPQITASREEIELEPVFSSTNWRRRRR